MKKDKIMVLLIIELILTVGLFLINLSDNSFILIKSLFLLSIIIISVVLLIQRCDFINSTKKNVNKIKLATDGNFNTRLFTNNDRVCDEMIFSINELIEKTEKVQVQAIRSQAKRRNLLSSISHDIRTPLTSVIGYADALRDQVATSKEEAEEYLEILTRKSNRLKQIIDEIFDMAKLDADEMPLNEECFDLAEIIRESLIEFLPEIKKNDVYLNVDIPDAQCLIEADQLSIMRIVTNLIQNALTHGKEGKIVEITLIDNGDEYEVCITDKGAGISSDDINYVFDRMYKGGRSRTGSNSGSGLGLSIVKSLVEKNGGKIWVKSLPWKKTVFGFTFPKA